MNILSSITSILILFGVSHGQTLSSYKYNLQFITQIPVSTYIEIFAYGLEGNEKLSINGTKVANTTLNGYILSDVFHFDDEDNNGPYDGFSFRIYKAGEANYIDTEVIPASKWNDCNEPYRVAPDPIIRVGICQPYKREYWNVNVNKMEIDESLTNEDVFNDSGLYIQVKAYVLSRQINRTKVAQVSENKAEWKEDFTFENGDFWGLTHAFQLTLYKEDGTWLGDTDMIYPEEIEVCNQDYQLMLTFPYMIDNNLRQGLKLNVTFTKKGCL